MQKLVILDELGQKQQLLCLGEFAPPPTLPDNWTAISYDGPEEEIALVEIVQVNGVPSIQSRASSLNELKIARWGSVKGIREAKIIGGIPVDGIGVFDSTPEAIQSVSGAAATALSMIVLGTPELFMVTWTLRDNSSIPLDAYQMLQVQSAGTHYINSVHQTARELRAQIDTATSEEELYAIDIYESWP